MTGSVLQTYMHRTKLEPNSSPVPEPETPEDLGAFGYLRGQKDRAIMLELRKRDGNIRAISYAYLERVEFDPSEGITLFVAGQKIQITGQNLNAKTKPNASLFNAITRHRVPWIRESYENETLQAPTGEASVESLAW